MCFGNVSFLKPSAVCLWWYSDFLSLGILIYEVAILKILSVAPRLPYRVYRSDWLTVVVMNTIRLLLFILFGEIFARSRARAPRALSSIREMFSRLFFFAADIFSTKDLNGQFNWNFCLYAWKRQKIVQVKILYMRKNLRVQFVVQRT